MRPFTRGLLTATALLIMSCHRTAVDLDEYRASCNAWCEHLFGCFDPLPSSIANPLPNAEACIEACLDNVPDTPECIEDDIEYSYCLAGMSCDQLSTFLNNPHNDQLDGLCNMEMWGASICK